MGAQCGRQQIMRRFLPQAAFCYCSLGLVILHDTLGCAPVEQPLPSSACKRREGAWGSGHPAAVEGIQACEQCRLARSHGRCCRGRIKATRVAINKQARGVP